MIDALDAAWAAGFLDADGSFIIRRGKPSTKSGNVSPIYAAEVTAVQVDPRPLFKLSGMFGGSVRVVRGRTAGEAPQHYQWHVTSRMALAVIEAVLPYLVTKADQARLAQELQTSGKFNGSRRLSRETLDYRESLYQAVRQLNRRGVVRGSEPHGSSTEKRSPQLRLLTG